MAANNKIILIGRIGNDPKEDTKHLASGSTVTELRLAVNRTAKDAQGNYITDWVTAQFWNKTAEMIQQYCEKGQMISISGSLRIDSWDKDGQKRQKYYVHGEEWYSLGSKKNAGNAPTAGKGAYEARQPSYNANNLALPDGEDPPF